MYTREAQWAFYSCHHGQCFMYRRQRVHTTRLRIKRNKIIFWNVNFLYTLIWIQMSSFCLFVVVVVHSYILILMTFWKLSLMCHIRYKLGNNLIRNRRKFITDNTIPCSAYSGAAIPSMLTDRRSIALAHRHLNQPQVGTLSYLRPLACMNGAVSSTSPATASVNNTAALLWWAGSHTSSRNPG